MSDYRSRRIDRDAAERLLDGDPTAGVAGLLALQLLAATAPAHSDELAGEPTVLAAFHAAARLDPVPQQRRPSMLKIALAKLLTVKAAAAVIAAGAGGVALAAGTGVLPVQLPERPTMPSVVSEAPAQPAELPSSAANAGDAAGTPSPSMTGLCKAYTAEVSTNPGKALESPAFTALITAAGGADKVDGFCETQAAASEADGATQSGVPAAPAAGDNAEKASGHAQVPTSRPEPPTGPPTGGPNG